ncbi:SgcJ/EcaC family oxidoreductase [Reyranella soli]|uniref:DUF4440 domain-containing protein n=1 Tax=Reyranella soli TaxID=1230389 RepID=A0A512NB44_9HYPH|nr:SgcJ/EcaC family oxidoreductase [Reyranella soli]GEP56168.1 hypothetical protein RSO01_33340 [Reyranella soli]
MKRLRRAACAAIIGVSALAGYVVVAGAQQMGATADEQAVRQVITDMTEGFNSHDGRAASRMYMPEARLVTVRGEVMEGQPAIEKGLTSIFETRAKTAMHRTLSVSIRFLRPDMALVHVTNELSGLVAPDGAALPPHQELSLRVLAKQDGRWQVAAFHNTMVRPFATSPR